MTPEIREKNKHWRAQWQLRDMREELWKRYEKQLLELPDAEKKKLRPAFNDDVTTLTIHQLNSRIKKLRTLRIELGRKELASWDF